jgi:predicted secreted hydrolase
VWLCIAPLALGLTTGLAEEDSWQSMMREARTGFAQPDPKVAIVFPADHGAHEAFALEWWYLTANLEDQQGRRFGLQWTLFRNRLTPDDGQGWQSPQVFLAHAAISDTETHLSDEKISRGDIGTAGVANEPFEAWIDDWRWLASGPEPFPAALKFDVQDNPVQLTLRSNGPYVRQGDRGYSVKNRSGSLASHYYSQPHLSISGQMGWQGQTLTVSGQGWFDREWSSEFLGDDDAGWDWFSIHLSDGAKMMLFQVRSEGDRFRQGTWIAPDGQVESLSADSIEMQPLDWRRIDGEEYPVRWRIMIENKDLDVSTTPLREDSVMRLSMRYWEGAIDVSGTHAGEGFLEMTGY